MTNNHELSSEPEQFPERIGDDYEAWKRYRETYGSEAYKYRRLYEAASRQLYDIYKYAEEEGIDLPDNGPDFT